MCKKAVRQKRMSLLIELDALKEKMCEDCSSKYYSGNKVKTGCTCEASIRMREIGEELMNLVSVRREQYQLEDVKQKGILDVSSYLELHMSGVPDLEMMDSLQIEKNSFAKWKKEYGLTKLIKKSAEEIEIIRKRFGHVVYPGNVLGREVV